MSEQPLSVQAVFDHALEIDSDAERKAFLDEVAAAAPEVCLEVAALLRAYEEAGRFLERPACPAVTTDGPSGRIDTGWDLGLEGGAAGAPRPDEGPGSHIGPYKLLEQIGEGSMGTVWMAQQEEPLRRLVALKLIKAGMDSAQVVARFEAERQALALMDHAHITRVFDAGTTAGGRPYFVMELVKGTPITRYCDDQGMTIRERLLLFADACSAVQHAHRKGIIHRDLKPSNVLVAPGDGRRLVKVIDFGVAKAMGQRLTEQTLFTGFGAVVGTLEYMSPEQAELNNQDIDTRSDIYGLGVLLYELLTGTTPLEHERLKRLSFPDALRAVREEEPPRPSTRLGASREALAGIAARRQTEPARLMRLVRGELDWIVMRCLEKDRNRRYESTSALAQDIERHLHDEAVEACPPSVGYRLRKFLNKHWAGVFLTAGVMGVLLAGMAVSTWQAVRATIAEKEAIAARDAKETALAEAVASEKKAVAAAAAERRAKQEALNSAKAARIAARSLRAMQMGTTNPQIDDSLLEVGRELWIGGLLPEAREALRDAVAQLENRLASLPGGSQQAAECRRQLVWSLFFLALSLECSGRPAEAVRAYRQAIAVEPANPAPWPKIGLSRLLATCPNEKLREPAEALALAREAVPLMGQEAHAWSTLGVALYRNGDFTAAIDALEKAIRLRPGSEAGDIITMDAFFLAMAYWQRGEPDNTRIWYERAVHGIEHVELLVRHRWPLAGILAGAPHGPLSVLPALYLKPPRGGREMDDFCFRIVRAEAAALLGVQQSTGSAPDKKP
jgi:serine/threonine protein kinase